MLYFFRLIFSVFTILLNRLKDTFISCLTKHQPSIDDGAVCVCVCVVRRGLGVEGLYILYLIALGLVLKHENAYA